MHLMEANSGLGELLVFKMNSIGLDIWPHRRQSAGFTVDWDARFAHSSIYHFTSYHSPEFHERKRMISNSATSTSMFPTVEFGEDYFMKVLWMKNHSACG